jgi:hypothetical protein
VSAAAGDAGHVFVQLLREHASLSHASPVLRHCAHYCRHLPPFLAVIVGYNATAGIGSPDSYFIVRNSWGNWGVEGGYIKVQMMADDKGACLMYAGLMLPTTTANKNTDPSPPPSPSPPPPPPSPPKPSPRPPSPKPCKGNPRNCSG